MKTTYLLLVSICLVFSLQAQTDELQAASPAIPASAIPPITAPRTAESLDTLLGPIALYPDALIALILPASTTPSDVVLANRYAQAKGDPATVAAQPWDDSVKALVLYPDVLKWMDENLAWTQALGQSFLAQPADVMNAVQRLRVRARATGALIDTPQQQVVTQGTTVVIVPAQPDIIYVPVYDPTVVYVQRTTVRINRPFITFGFGYQIGPRFIYDCDWDRRTVCVVSRPPTWHSQPQYSSRNTAHPEKLPPQPWHPPSDYRPHSDIQVNTHTPTLRPIRIDPRKSPSDPTQIPSSSPRPQTGSPGMVTSAPNRSSHIPSPRKDLIPPVEIVPAAPLPSAPTTPVQVTPRPMLAKPQAPTRPTRPFNVEPTDRLHHTITPTPITGPATDEDPAKLDQRKRRPTP